VFAQDAKWLGMTIPQLDWWVNEGGGSDYYRKLRAARALEAEYAPQRQQRAQREAKLRAEGWQGGPTDPLADCIPKNDADVLRLLRRGAA
jgi:hypothetical protein